mgnify:FL=1
MTKPVITLSLLCASIGLISGCKYFREGVSEEVAIRSYPSGAAVIIEGRPVGATPMTMEFARKIPHRFSLEKDGYKDWDQQIFPILNEWGMAYVRFQLATDLGFYYNLVPNPVEIQMEPALVPDSIGTDPFGQLADLVLEADAMLKRGEISPSEHRYMVQEITNFFAE